MINGEQRQREESEHLHPQKPQHQHQHRHRYLRPFLLFPMLSFIWNKPWRSQERFISMSKVDNVLCALPRAQFDDYALERAIGNSNLKASPACVMDKRFAWASGS